MMKQLYFILFLFVSCPLVGQNQDTFSPSSSLSFSPQYMIMNGLKVNGEWKLNNKDHWIQLSPQLYYYEGNNWEYDRLIGWGMDIHYKIYLNPENPGLGSYFSYGGILRSHTIDYPTQDWLDYEEEGLTYYEYRQFSTTQHIWKTGPNLLFGYRWMPFRRLVVDAYLGAGLRISFHSKDSEHDRKFSTSMVDFGYSGTIMVGGIHLGVLF